MTPPDPALLQIFAAEQAELLQRMRSIVSGFSDAAADPAGIEELFRRAHTLKGASRAVGFEQTEALTHAMETVLANLRAGELTFSSSLRGVLFRSFDAMEDVLTAILGGQPAPAISNLIRELAEITGERPRIGSFPIEAIVEALPQASEPVPGANTGAEFVRINATYLDELMSASSELVASTAGADAEPEATSEVARAGEALREWMHLRQNITAYLRRKQDDPEFAPVLECIESAERSFQSLVSEIRAEAAARRQLEWERQRLVNRLDETAFRVRMVSADTVFGGFGPMLRRLAQESGKRIEYRAEGLEIPGDRILLQALKDPLMHLLRNAVSHGVEPELERLAAGKPASATIQLSIRSQGDRLQVVVEDDGRGLDRKALVEEAVQRGILSDSKSAVPEEALAELIFLPGFSTSAALTTVSGRGMGLAIVRHEVNRFHGDIQVRSQPGKGTSFTLSLPLSVSSQHVLLVEVAGHTYGILTSFVQGLRRIHRSELQPFEGKAAIVIDDRPIVLAQLADLLNLSGTAAPGANPDHLQMVIVTAGGRTAALVVERLLDVRDVVIKPVGLPASKSGFTSGAIPLPDGSVGLILKMADLLSRLREVSAAHADTFLATGSPERADTILVVDDSMTTRSLEKSLLESHGYQVRVAVDGVEALAKLHAEPVDLVITDITMPRMDGFQLLEQIRKDKLLSQIPVIVVSSVDSRADQERGLALGADAYITKRKFDQRELLETVRQIL